MSELVFPSETLKAPHLIGGEFIQDGRPFSVDSPYFGKEVGVSYQADQNHIDNAVADAKRAQDLWGKTPIKERCQVMLSWRQEILKNIEEISICISLENGKTISEARAGLMKGVEVLEYALSLQNHDDGAIMEVSRGVHCQYRRVPVGVTACITPFNFPAMVPMWTIPITLTLGNAVIWKPSEKTPLTSKLLAQTAIDAGLPKGLLSILNGDSKAVEKIIDHKDVTAVSFVGSTKIAKIVYKRASSLGKRSLALGGAKNHIILLPDATVDIAGKGISDSFTGCAGQRCMAASVLLAVGDCQGQIDHIKERAKSLKLGTDMGAIITKEQVEFLEKSIDEAIKEGATLLLDGRKQRPSSEFEEGFWIGPTILDNVTPSMKCAQDELFGPIMCIIRCQNIAEAIEIENNNPYGNAASVFTSNGQLAERVCQSAKAGMVGVNIGVPVPREPFSFGGINDSKFGHGDITGDNSLGLWSDMKKITTKWEKQNDANWMS